MSKLYGIPPSQTYLQGSSKTPATPVKNTGAHGTRETQKRLFTGTGWHPGRNLMAFPFVLVPKVTEMTQHFLTTGQFCKRWALAILSPMPKEKGVISVDELPPLCLQNVLFKGVSMVLYLMLKDLIHFLNPPPPRTKRVYEKQIHLRTHLGCLGSLGWYGGRSFRVH